MPSLSAISNQPNQQEPPEGSVARQVVIGVLEAVAGAGGFSVSVNGDTVTIVCNGVPEVQVLPDPVGRRMILRFVHKYKIKVEYFFHPELVHQNPSGQKH